jgi:hypothetical protein
MDLSIDPKFLGGPSRKQRIHRKDNKLSNIGGFTRWVHPMLPGGPQDRRSASGENGSAGILPASFRLFCRRDAALPARRSGKLARRRAEHRSAGAFSTARCRAGLPDLPTEEFRLKVNEIPAITI